MRLIDADALEESLENSCKDTYETKMFVDFMSYVDEAPTIKQSENCISRQNATAKLFQSMIINSSEFGNELSLEEKKFNDGLRKAVEIIRSLPNIKPQTKRGNWIETSLTPISGGDFNRGFKCSCCDYVTVVDDFNFCPNCGSKMEVEE